MLFSFVPSNDFFLLVSDGLFELAWGFPRALFLLVLRIASGTSEILRGVRKKSGPGVKSSNFSANIGPTETYYIPNQWKLNKAFAELCRFEIAALIE